MSAGPILDSVDFARGRHALRGEIVTARLERLQDVLFDGSTSVVYDLKGALDQDGRPNLLLELSGTLNLVCNRCLASLQYQVAARRRFILIAPDEDPGDVADEAEDVEHVPASSALDVTALVEDELLLSLPISAAHEMGTCKPRSWQYGEAAIRTPFRQLARLQDLPGTEG